LADWLKGKLEAFQASRPTDEEVATAAMAELGFKITKHNITGMRDALNVSWKPKRTTSEDELYELAERVAVLESTIQHLVQHIGVKTDFSGLAHIEQLLEKDSMTRYGL
jgi:hypothetical protein